MSLTGLAIWGLMFLFVPLLAERGISTQAAAIALGIGGVGQLCGRLGYRRLSEAVAVRSRTQLVFAAVAATTLGLAIIPGPYLLLALLSFLAGSARGIYTLVQATAVADRWGTAQYAKLNAIASVPILATAALAPWIGTALAVALGSYGATVALLAGLAATAVLVVPSMVAVQQVRHRGDGVARRPIDADQRGRRGPAPVAVPDEEDPAVAD
jgi:hypothetical protein